MIRVHAPFLVANRWTWITFRTAHANTHAACSEHATAIGATAWDASQASVEIAGSVVRGHPTVFA